MKYKVLFLILLLIIPCIIIVGRHFYAPTRHRFFLKTDVESSSFTEFPLPASMAIVQQSAVSFNEDKMVIAGCESNNLKIYTCDFLGNKLKDKFILFSELSHTIDCKALNFTLYGDDLVGVVTQVELKDGEKFDVDRLEDYYVFDTLYVFSHNKIPKHIPLKFGHRKLSQYTQGRGGYDVVMPTTNTILLVKGKEIMSISLDGKSKRVFVSALENFAQIKLVPSKNLAFYQHSIPDVKTEVIPEYLEMDSNYNVVKKIQCPVALDIGANVIYNSYNNTWAFIKCSYEGVGCAVVDRRGRTSSKVFVPDKYFTEIINYDDMNSMFVGVIYAVFPKQRKILSSFSKYEDLMNADSWDKHDTKITHLGLLDYN